MKVFRYFTLACVVLQVLIGVGCSQEVPSSRWRDEGTPASRGLAQSTGGKALVQFPVELTVENPLSRQQRIALVEGGFPLPEAAVMSVEALTLTDSDGGAIVVQARPLAYWPDASVKWVALVFYLDELQAGERRSLRLGRTDAPDRAEGDHTENIPDHGLLFELTRQDGIHSFHSEKSSCRYAGTICAEYLHEGFFDGRQGQTEATISVTRFPAISAVRYRVGLKQLVNGDNWDALRLVLPHPYALVHRAKEMGARVSALDATHVEVGLIEQAEEPVDRGVGRRWEIWGYDDPDLFGGRPLRPRLSPRYLRTTGVLGEFVVDAPEEWERNFERSFESVFAQRDRDPRNFGWRHYGSFFDRRPGTSLAYFGYVNQEYDPATALVLAYARTGNLAYLEHAEDLACLFRDMCLSPEGGVYQHRATIHAGDAHIISIMKNTLRKRILAHPSYAATSDALGEVVTALYGEQYGDLRAAVKKVLEPIIDRPFDEQLTYLAQALAAGILDDIRNNLRNKFERLDPKEFEKLDLNNNIRRWFEFYAADERVKALGFTDVDSDFEPFFERYGGSWDDFPAFHVDLRPDPKRHEGGHSLVEMLVWTYCFTGDEGLRDAALRVARHQIEVICPFVLEQNRGVVGHAEATHTRQLSWPLINLVSLWELTQNRDPELHRQIVEVAQQLAYQLTENRVDQHQGGIHAGIGMEALARYHEKTGDGRVAQYLIKWARYWAATQWEVGRGFRYIRDKNGSADESMTALVLYGLAYAHDLAPEDALKGRVLEARDLLQGKQSGSYVKMFAQMYRSTPRALAHIGQWDGNE
ncbi:MAG: hypothetical protein GWP08_08100 [Nitrospiraceae bacterium]|nr:hypothetical protein [Nitrospiraceae bacterium]